LWLDPKKRVSVGFISHAHADHIRKHNKIIATASTIKFYQQRCGLKSDLISLEFGVPVEFENLTIELFPSGHILGAAQILIIREGIRLVYTGDFNPRKSDTAENMEIRNADILITEATFGLPHYKFPPRWQVIKKLIEFIDDCFDKGIVPVIMSYTLGKSQEVIKILGDLNYQVSVYKSIYKMTKIYEECGIILKNWKQFEGEELKDRVMIIPPYMKNWIGGLYKGKIKTAIVTGWAMDKNCKYRYGADDAIPLSDHADFYELM